MTKSINLDSSIEAIQPFHIETSQAELDDLHLRLSLTR
ncbi:hypothetical protein SAMN05518855_10299 [Paenibacillus sp. CF384]|nr:hypothetical protein SAMN05518855_10299 [Paenibacillus sp. CF384]